jgi:hypothetical protein
MNPESVRTLVEWTCSNASEMHTFFFFPGDETGLSDGEIVDQVCQSYNQPNINLVKRLLATSQDIHRPMLWPHIFRPHDRNFNTHITVTPSISWNNNSASGVWLERPITEQTGTVCLCNIGD